MDVASAAAKREPARIRAPARPPGNGDGAVAGLLDLALAGPAGAGPTLDLGLDAGLRVRTALSLQRTAGNRAMALAVQRDPPPSVWDLAPNPYATTTPGGGAAPELGANPYVQETDPVTLSNPRFTGERRLGRIASGQASLSSADNGSAVRAVQQALIDLGFEMVRHERDGQFGAETREAINLFRSRRGLPPGDLTARALGELDRTVPAAGREEHYYDYERLFADGYLDVTIAVGFDERGAQADLLQGAHDWLTRKGFEQLQTTAGQPEQHRLRLDITYPTRGGDRITREVIVRLSLISPGPGAAEQYGNALADSEIAVYAGHARRGIGPDFDEDKSAKENFIIGVGSALHAAGRAIEPSRIEQNHYVIDRVNDLEQMTQAGRFDRERYRIWLFAACTSLAYFDELRGGILPGHMDRRNLDLLGTRQPLGKSAAMPGILAMLEGVLAANTIEAVVDAMNRAGAIAEGILPADTNRAVANAPRVFVHEGAGDNPIAPAPATP